MQQEQLKKKSTPEMDFLTDYGDANRYKIQEIVGKGSYGVVCSAIDTHSGEKVAIKKIHNIFEHISDAIRILREIKLLRLLRHPDIVQIKHIILPPTRRDFKDIYVVFELMESDLHQVIKVNDDLTREHYLFFLYQLLRAVKYIHSANVYHRDLKPKNILANANCKLKICDFGLARVAFNDVPTAVFWTDYVATRWYRAPELCGSFYSKALANPYFKVLAKADREPSCLSISKTEFEFERTKMTNEGIRELIFREILEYHPHLQKDYINGSEVTNFIYPSAVGQFREQFTYLEENGGKSGPVIPLQRKHVSLPRSTVVHTAPTPPKEQPCLATLREMQASDEPSINPRGRVALAEDLARTSQLPQAIPIVNPGSVLGPVMPLENGSINNNYDSTRLMGNAVLLQHTAHVPTWLTNNNSALPLQQHASNLTRQTCNTVQLQPNAGKMASDIAVDMWFHPYCLSHGAMTDRIELRRRQRQFR